MMLENNIIEFKGMPLFHRAVFEAPLQIEGTVEDYACVFYLMEGTMCSYDNRGEHKINNKEALIKNCNNYIQRFIPQKNKSSCEAIVVYLYPELLKNIFNDQTIHYLIDKDIPEAKKLFGNKLIDQYMKNLAIYFETPESLDEDLGILKIKELIMILLKSENHQNIRKLLSEIFAPVNVAFKQAVEHNIFNALNIEELAFICNMSVSTFKRSFKKTFQETPAKYIKHKRLEHAAKLLTTTNDSIASVAYESGFQDITTFSENFKSKFNVTPRSYRLNFFRT